MYWFHTFAAFFTTTTAYHLHALLTFDTKFFGSSLNIAYPNAIIYTSKLTISRFIFKFIGSLIECGLFQITLITLKKSYKDVINSLESAIKSAETEIQTALKTQVLELNLKSINVDSTINDILEPIKDIPENIDLSKCAERIKKPSKKDPFDLKTYDDKAGKIVIDAMTSAKDEFWEILTKHHFTQRIELEQRSQEHAGYILNIQKISKAIKQGDNILYDFKTIFNDIVKNSIPQIWEIMKQGSSRGIWANDRKINEKKKLGYQLLALLITKMSAKLSAHSEGMKRKLETIESAVEIAETIVDKTEDIKTRIQTKSLVIIGHIKNQNIKNVKEAMMKEDQAIEKVITDKSYGKGSDGRAREIIQHAEKISESILGIESIQRVVDKYAPSYLLIATALEYTLKKEARNITNTLTSTEQQSKTTTLIVQSMKTEPDELVKTMVKNMITDIIIHHSTQIAENPDEKQIINQIKSMVKSGVCEETRKEKMKKTVSEIKKRTAVLTKANNMTQFIVDRDNISKLVGIAASILGREIKEHKELITEIIKDAIKHTITDHASTITKIEDGGNIKESIVTTIIAEITRMLAVKSDEITVLKAHYAAIDCRKICSIITLSAMLATRAMMLWEIRGSTKLSYESYIIMIIESLFFGMFQNSLLTLAAEHSETIRLSIELSHVLVFVLHVILAKLFYKNDRAALTVQIWFMFAMNVLAIIMWTCSVFADLLGIHTDGDKTEKNNNHKSSLWSPYLMFFFAALVKEFLFPRILPNALVTHDNSMMRIISPALSISGILVAMSIIWSGKTNKKKDGEFDIFWAFLGPPLVVCVMALSAIHKRGGAIKYILENKPFVIFLCFVLLLCYSVISTVSYVGVAHYVEKRKERFKGYIESHSILCEFIVFFISRVSVGYDNVRKEYGLGLNVTIPDAMEQPKPIVFARKCLTSGWKATVRDFKTNVAECL